MIRFYMKAGDNVLMFGFRQANVLDCSAEGIHIHPYPFMDIVVAAHILYEIAHLFDVICRSLAVNLRIRDCRLKRWQHVLARLDNGISLESTDVVCKLVFSRRTKLIVRRRNNWRCRREILRCRELIGNHRQPPFRHLVVAPPVGMNVVFIDDSVIIALYIVIQIGQIHPSLREDVHVRLDSVIEVINEIR